MPGLIIYFFGLSMISSPLYRYALFVTPVAKGTTAAVLSLADMGILAIGIEIGNKVYTTHNNYHLGYYCLILGLVFLVFWGLIMKMQGTKNLKAVE
jgi:DHA1 family multidrug/chloramphenicol efflux transport protein-like MFS transporter